MKVSHHHRRHHHHHHHHRPVVGELEKVCSHPAEQEGGHMVGQRPGARTRTGWMEDGNWGESTKTNFNANFWSFLLDQKSFFFQHVLVYTQPTKIWKEKLPNQNMERKGHQANKNTSVGASGIGVLVLWESSKIFKTGNCVGSTCNFVNFLHCAY